MSRKSYKGTELQSDRVMVGRATAWQVFLFMLIYGGAMIVVGWSMGEPWGYHEGVKDGKNATMLVDMTKNPCQITYEIRKLKELK